MISEQSTDADDPGARALTKRCRQGFAQCYPFDQRQEKPDEKGYCHNLERLHVTGQGREDRKCAP